MSLVDVNGKPLTVPRQKWSGRTPTPISNAMGQQGMNSTADLGPGQPQTPRAGYSIRPRANDYPIGVNLSTQSRESWGRTSYAVIKGIIDAYDVARMCINHKIDELRSMEPLFVPAEGVSGDVTAAIDAARLVMAFPDRENDWAAWLNILLENALTYDSTPLYRRRNMDGEIIALENLDGATIFPYVDENGRRPKAPAPAYFQRIKGLTDAWYTAEDIAYNRYRPQSNSPYGLAPIESVLLTANTDIRFQWHFLQMFTDGSIPGGFIDLPPDISSPDQVNEWQEYWDSITLGDQSILHKLIAVPNGTKISETRPKTFDEKFPQYLMSRTAAAFGVVPQDLGIVADVNRANGETQTDIQFRVNTLPWVLWVQGIVNRYLQLDLGLPVAMKLNTGRDTEDSLAEAQRWGVLVQNAAASADEMRTALTGLPVDNERPTPRGFVSSRVGFVPLSSVEAVSGPIDPETASPDHDVPLDQTPFEGTPGLFAYKAPGGAEFKRAPINPDDPEFPELEHPVPGTDVAGAPAPLTKADGATAGVTAATGVHGADLIEDEDNAEVAKSALLTFGAQMDAVDEARELAAFRKFAKSAQRKGKWRDFVFEYIDGRRAHRLNDAARAEMRKAAGEIVAAGLAVQAQDTGRVLVLQRGFDDDDTKSGKLEFPGGHLEDGETPLQAATREWCEEVGLVLPHFGNIVGEWQASNGIYVGFVYQIDSEAQVQVRGPGVVTNPDDPDGDQLEAVLWMDPADLVGNPMVRDELAADLGVVVPLLGSETATPVPETDSLEDLVEDNGLGILDDIPEPVAAAAVDAVEDDADPKGEALAKSWRDTPNVTPQHEYDLTITDHYLDAVREAVQATIRAVPIQQIADQVAGSLRKKTAPDDLDAFAREVQQQIAALPQLDSGDLEATIRQVLVDGYLAGGHAGMQQVGAHAVTLDGSTGQAIINIDWSAWTPGDTLAAEQAADGGLKALLDDVGVTVKGINDTTLTRIGNKIAAGLAAGDNGDTIASDILDDVGSQSRAESIAYTETARAVTAATMDVYQINGVAEWDLITSAGACIRCLDEEANNPHRVGGSATEVPIHTFCRCASAPHATS